MKKKDFHQLVLPLADKLFNFAYTLVPDDLQAEQLVIDGLNAYLLKEKRNIQNREVDLSNKKETLLMRRLFYKGILRYMADIGVRRSLQLSEQMRLNRPLEYAHFFNLGAKERMILSLRYKAQFTVDEIVEIIQVPRYEVIEKIHNGRFLLLNNLNPGMNP